MARIDELPPNARRSVVDGERPSARWDEDRFTCSDVWIVPSEDLAQFLRVAGGTVETVGGVLNRVVPLRNADFDFAVATSITCDFNRGGWDGIQNTFDVCRVRIEYASPKYGDDYLSVTSSPDTRILYKPASIATGLAQEVVHGTQYNVTVHKSATLDLATFSAYGGYINNAAWRGFDAYKVLYVGPASNQTTTTGGVTSYDVTHTFRVSRVRWDYDYDPTGTLVSAGVPPSVDFNTVFGF